MPTICKKPLPRPSDTGHYWLGEKHSDPPSIVLSSLQNRKGKYLCGTEDGPLLDGDRIAYFDSPLEALLALQKAGWAREYKV